ncbi:MAG TPA: ribosomal protein S18-alanine N-acetyltransferase [Candidatus Acidoferrum sp.]|nr:ribosomal protein S18-alanine N-acetyltransferase [Candidatus Acidoferrum sp.]
MGEAETRAAGRAIRTREFCAEDAAAVLAVARSSPQAAQWSEESYQRILEEPTAVCFVAEAEGAVVGFLTGRLTADQGEILNLAVGESYRRRGAASSLLAQALEWFRLSSATSVYLEVRESNTGAIGFYEKNGFLNAGRREGYYRDPDEAALVLTRKLTG